MKGCLKFVLAFLYVVWPLDLIPDIIAVIGFIDDVAVVIAAASRLFGRD